ncbi:MULTISPECIES: hypothetical protein [unclassified Streptomyces]|uniref:hypothetical protein n=1 Tax=unclassified Streptomyces TaxID=2593676 RepID=UPI002E0F3570|nr:hypothetical protein OG452_28495 [Streptomyces sp. NBC_01197]WSS48294.1 hypothetical protein OG708_06360 [Streptomyces sp. NBC_01180]
MSRRVSLPGADELFRTTGGMALQSSSPRRPVNGEARIPGPAGESDPAAPSAERAESAAGEHSAAAAETTESRTRTAEAEAAAARRPQEARPMTTPVAPAGQQRRRGGGRGANRRPTGRERHDEKITVYVSAEELMDLEHARLVLRGEHGLAVDRGRIVREAVAVVLADLESRGDASILVRRLRGR